MVLIEEADARIAIVAGVRPGHLADAPGFDRFVSGPIRVVGGPVGADLQNLPGPLDGVAQLQCLLDCVGHRFFAIHMFARFHSVHRNLRVPMIRRSDQHGVDVLSFEQPPVIEKALAAADVLRTREAPLINIRYGEYLEVVGVTAFDERAEMAGAHAAAADHGEGDAVVRSEDSAG